MATLFRAETQQVVFVRKHKPTHRIIQNASKQALQSLVMNPGRAVTQECRADPGKTPVMRC